MRPPSCLRQRRPLKGVQPSDRWHWWGRLWKKGIGTSKELEGFPGGTNGKESACQCRRRKRRGFDSWVGKIPWRRIQYPTPVLLPGESHRQRNLASHGPHGSESNMTKATEQAREGPRCWRIAEATGGCHLSPFPLYFLCNQRWDKKPTCSAAIRQVWSSGKWVLQNSLAFCGWVCSGPCTSSFPFRRLTPHPLKALAFRNLYPWWLMLCGTLAGPWCPDLYQILVKMRLKSNSSDAI